MSKFYDLGRLVTHAEELLFSTERSSPDRLLVKITPSATLEFHNLRAEADTLIGFSQTGWHSHGRLELMANQSSSVELDEFDILDGIKRGEILVVEQYNQGKLLGRWLTHKGEPIDLKWIEPGEEMRFLSID